MSGGDVNNVKDGENRQEEKRKIATKIHRWRQKVGVTKEDAGGRSSAVVTHKESSQLKKKKSKRF